MKIKFQKDNKMTLKEMVDFLKTQNIKDGIKVQHIEGVTIVKW